MVNTPFMRSSVNAAGVAISTSVNCTFAFSTNCFSTLQFGQFFVEYIMMPCTLLISLHTGILFKTYNGFSNYIWILIEGFVIVFSIIFVIMFDYLWIVFVIVFIILFITTSIIRY